MFWSLYVTSPEKVIIFDFSKGLKKKHVYFFSQASVAKLITYQFNILNRIKLLNIIFFVLLSS